MPEISASCWILFLSLALALTPHARRIILAFFCSRALRSFLDNISVTTSSNSYAIWIFLSSVSHSGVAIWISIYLFTALLRPENEKSRESRSRRTSGKIPSYAPLYFSARSAIFFHPGKPMPSIFDTLSKHSPAASSWVCPIISRSNSELHA